MKLQRFLSELVGMMSLFAVTPSTQPVETEYLDLMLEIETLP
jgi:hypothetical protein